MIAWLKTSGPVLFRDAAGLIAVGSIAYGAWLIYAPAGFISAGALVLAGAIAAARGGR